MLFCWPTNALRLATAKLAVSKSPGKWNRSSKLVAVASMIGGTTGVAVNQAFQLRTEWKTRVAVRSGGPCRGPTEGVEVAPPCNSCNDRTLVVGQHSEEPRPSRGVTLLFLGDSLVAGVGGQNDDDNRAPPLPRDLAASLAARIGRSVRWVSVGIPGAGVERLLQEGLPELRTKLCSRGDDETIVVVLVVGANDLRQRNIVRYRLALRGLVDELRTLGDRAVEGVFLPSLQLTDAPMLQRFPLSLFLTPIGVLWEREKRKAVGRFENAEVLSFPSVPDNTDTTELFCADQMHPSASGYKFWAEGLAQQIDQWLWKRRSHRLSGSDECNASGLFAEFFLPHEAIW